MAAVHGYAACDVVVGEDGLDVDMDAMVKEYYQKWYGMELIDEDVANILTAPAQTYRHY